MWKLISIKTYFTITIQSAKIPEHSVKFQETVLAGPLKTK
jgi:hypothetical protein